MDALELLKFITSRNLGYSVIEKRDGQEVILFVDFCHLADFAKLIRADFKTEPIMVCLKGYCVGIEMRDYCENAGFTLEDVFDLEK